MYTPVLIYESGVHGVYINTRTCYPDAEKCQTVLIFGCASHFVKSSGLEIKPCFTCDAAHFFTVGTEYDGRRS